MLTGPYDKILRSIWWNLLKSKHWNLWKPVKSGWSKSSEFLLNLIDPKVIDPKPSKSHRSETAEISESYLILRADIGTIPPSLFFWSLFFSLGNPVGCHSLPAQSSFCLSICTGWPPPDILLSPSKLVLIMLCFAPRLHRIHLVQGCGSE